MPTITTAGTFDKSTPGFEGLAATPQARAFLFAGSSIGSSCLIQYTDDADTDQTLANGSISALPTSAIVRTDSDLKIVTTGAPNFNLTITRVTD